MSHFTDIHILTHGAGSDLRLVVDRSLIFPGTRNASETERPMMERLLGACVGHERDDFMVEDAGVFYRVRRDQRAVDGTWYRLRKMAETAPDLSSLPSPLPQAMCDELLRKDLTSGGMVYIIGGPGSGKTYTASATVVSRLRAYGGVAYTVEDPPEMPLNGRHGEGYCTQTNVAGDTAADWVESMRGVLRSQPVGTPLMMYVGEIRDPDSARVMLRAASNGFLVICTGFGSDIVSSIDSLLHMVGREYMATVGHLLRVVLHQTIRSGRLSAEMLTSQNASSRVAAIIRGGQLAHLKDELQAQKNAMLAAHRIGGRASAAASPSAAGASSGAQSGGRQTATSQQSQ